MSQVGPETHRSPGPDVARGVALGIVAMSNTIWWVYPQRADGSLLWESADKWSEAISAMFISGRAYPMFSFLFGYGIIQMLSHLAARGVSRRRAEVIVLRRNVLLIILGFLHALLLFSGDVLGSYGILGFFCLVLARARFTTMVMVAVAFLCLRIVYDIKGWAWEWTAHYDVALETSYVGAMDVRIKDWASSWSNLPFYLAPMLFGVAAARQRLLEDAGRHRHLLVTLIVVGFAVSILSGLPQALVALERWLPEGEDTWTYIQVIGGVGGIAGGIALAALASLLAHEAGSAGALNALLEPLRCLGRRSLSGYLFQSMAFVVIFPSFALGFGGRAGPTVCFLIALTVWAVSLILAVILERFGRVGPGEWLTRRITYGSPRKRVLN